MKKIYGILMMMFVALFAMTSCSEDTPAGEAKDIVPNPAELVFLATGSEAQTVTFVANADWKASSEQGWIQIANPVGKAGENTLSVTVKESLSKENREGVITISEESTGKTAVIKVVQGAADLSIVCEGDGKFIVNNADKKITNIATVVSALSYDIECNVDWITYDKETLKEQNQVIFKVNSEKAPFEAADINIKFITSDKSESSDYKITWEGYEPKLYFYKDEQCTEELGEDKIIEIKKGISGHTGLIYVKSNYPWSIKTDISGTILSEITLGQETFSLPRIFESVTSFMAVYDETKLDTDDYSTEVEIAFGDKVEELIVHKAGVGEGFVEIDFKGFEELKADAQGSGARMFPATANEPEDEDNPNGDKRALEISFDVKSSLKETYPIIMFYDFSTDSYSPIPSISPGVGCEKKSANVYNVVPTINYTLWVNDRSSSSNDDGKAKYYKVFMAETNSWRDYFRPIDDSYTKFRLKETQKKAISEGVLFGQEAYVKLYEVSSKDFSKKEPYVEHEISKDGGELPISYMVNEESPLMINIYGGNLTLSNDGNFIENYGFIYEGDPIGYFESLDPVNNKFTDKYKITSNDTGKERTFIVHLGVWMGDGKKDQYIGSFVVKQSAN